MIELKSIRKKYKNFELGPVDLSIHDDEYFVLLGRSGSGKSLLLELIAGLQRMDSGDVFIDGVNATSLPIQKRNIGFVFQNNALFPHMTIEKNIFFTLNKSAINSRKEFISKTLISLGIQDLLDRYPGSLSSGESHRVAIARTLMTNPKYLILDEPLSSLDKSIKYEIRTLLRKINNGSLIQSDTLSQREKTILHVTHDYEEAIALGDRIGVIDNGKLIQIGETEEIFRKPKSEFVASFVGIKNFYKGTIISSENESSFILEKNKTVKIAVSDNSKVTSNEQSIAIIKSENVIISTSELKSSARNVFKGIIEGIEKTEHGFELKVFITKDFYIYAKITLKSYSSMNLSTGKEVFICFKASAVEIISIAN